MSNFHKTPNNYEKSYGLENEMSLNVEKKKIKKGYLSSYKVGIPLNCVFFLHLSV